MTSAVVTQGWEVFFPEFYKGWSPQKCQDNNYFFAKVAKMAIIYPAILAKIVFCQRRTPSLFNFPIK